MRACVRACVLCCVVSCLSAVWHPALISRGRERDPPRWSLAKTCVFNLCICLDADADADADADMPMLMPGECEYVDFPKVCIYVYVYRNVMYTNMSVSK